MIRLVTLPAFLATWAGDDTARAAVATTVIAIASAGLRIADMVAQGPLAEHFAKARGAHANAGGDTQKELDVIAEDAIVDALKSAPVAYLGSEESETPIAISPNGRLVVAVDPLDGSSNIDTNVSIGTIYSILPYDPDVLPDPNAALMQKGVAQVAAGFLIYGPSTVLVSTLGEGTQVFVHDRVSDAFILARAAVEIPAETREYGINQSNMRHWAAPMTAYLTDCLAGADGPRGKDFNMRWVGSMVADAFRIFTRGGVYLYPGDARKGYGEGRLRLIYEANPIAFLTEQAKGAATDGVRRILDIPPTDLHQRIPLVFGSREEVARIAAYH